MYKKIITVALFLIFFVSSILLTFRVLAFNPGVHNFLAHQIMGENYYPQERRELLRYFQNGAPAVSGSYSQSERAHIVDIQGLIEPAVSFTDSFIIISFVILVVTIFLGVGITRRSVESFFAQASLWWLVLLMTAILFFNELFLLFHQAAFPNGNWLFDPRYDLIIRVYPPEFFLLFFLSVASCIEGIFVSLFFLLKNHRREQ